MFSKCSVLTSLSFQNNILLKEEKKLRFRTQTKGFGLNDFCQLS